MSLLGVVGALMISPVALADPPPSPSPSPPPAPAPELPLAQGVLLSVDAYGTLVAGNVVVDTEKLAAVGISLHRDRSPGFSSGGPVVQKLAPLADGLRVVGLASGERLVDGAIDTLMYFDANGDTYLDPLDPAFAAIAVFDDRNGDRKVQTGEIRYLSALGVASISRFGSITMVERGAR